MNSQFPNLNPAEHIWVKWKILIMDVHPINLQQLRDTIMSIWTKVSEECFQHVAEFVPRRNKALLKVKGVQLCTSKVYLRKRLVTFTMLVSIITRRFHLHIYYKYCLRKMTFLCRTISCTENTRTQCWSEHEGWKGSGAVLTEQRGKLGRDCLKLENLGLSRKYRYKILYLAPENHKARGLLQCVSQIRSKIDFSLVFKVKW